MDRLKRWASFKVQHSAQAASMVSPAAGNLASQSEPVSSRTDALHRATQRFTHIQHTHTVAACAQQEVCRGQAVGRYPALRFDDATTPGIGRGITVAAKLGVLFGWKELGPTPALLVCQAQADRVNFKIIGPLDIAGTVGKTGDQHIARLRDGQAPRR